jgi:spermidine/putrescine transport system substrate-binding protein
MVLERSLSDESQESENSGERKPETGSLTSRRKVMAATGGIVTGAAGCTRLAGKESTGSGEYAGETLRVTVWSGNYADRFEESVKPMFEEESGATLQINRGWEEILAQIQSAPEDNPPYDVTITEGQLYYLGRQDDLFEPLRKENIPEPR